MQIHIKLFAGLKEMAGTDHLEMELAESTSVEQALESVSKHYPDLSSKLATCLYAVNQTYVSRTDLLSSGDELAIIPPVSGG